MIVLLEMVAQREVQKRCGRRGEFHAGRQTALDECKIAGRQMAVEIRHKSSYLDPLRHVEFCGIQPGTYDHDHAQFGDQGLGHGIGFQNAPDQRRTHTGAADRYDAGQAPVVVSKLLEPNSEGCRPMM